MQINLIKGAVYVPDGIDPDVVSKWIPKESFIYKQVCSPGNFCVAYQYNDIFSFARFFSLGDKTICSVDFQSHSQEQMIHKLIEILEDKFAF